VRFPDAIGPRRALAAPWSYGSLSGFLLSTGALAFAAYGALAGAARELLASGTSAYATAVLLADDRAAAFRR